MRWARKVVGMGEKRNSYRVLVGQPKGKRPLCRPRHRWENNIKIDFREMVGVVWNGFIWLRVEISGVLL
jgi:hypothetical protein